SSRRPRVSLRPSSTGHSGANGGIVEFIRAHQGHRAEPGGLRWGVEPICRVLSEPGLQVAPSTYYDHLEKPLTARQQRVRQLKLDIARVHAANYGVYGA